MRRKHGRFSHYTAGRPTVCMDSRSEFLKVVLFILSIGSVIIFLVLATALLSKNGTLAKWKEDFKEWQLDRKRKNGGDKSVTYFGPSGISEYESWFLAGEAVYPAGAFDMTGKENPDDLSSEEVLEGYGGAFSGEATKKKYMEAREERKKLLASPVKGNEEWWVDSIRLSERVLLFAQADTPLFGSPEKSGEAFAQAVAGECMQLVAIICDNWYVVTDGLWYYCSEGARFSPVLPEIIDFDAVLKNLAMKSVKHSVKEICQNPELPHGCEVTALTILLDFYGITVDKCELADNWMPKGEWGETNFWKAFVGNPRKSFRSAGCYAPVMEETANRYLTSSSNSLTAVAGTQISFEELLNKLTKHPVLAWTTMKLAAPYIAQVFTVDGEELLWQNAEHCVVLTGYDTERGVLFGMDPLYGKCEYDMRLFALRFRTMYSQVLELE